MSAWVIFVILPLIAILVIAGLLVAAIDLLIGTRKAKKPERSEAERMGDQMIDYVLERLGVRSKKEVTVTQKKSWAERSIGLVLIVSMIIATFLTVQVFSDCYSGGGLLDVLAWLFMWFLQLFLFALPGCFGVFAAVYVAYRVAIRIGSRRVIDQEEDQIDRLVKWLRSKK